VKWSIITLHYFDESTHNSVQRLHPLRHVGREEPENDSVLVHQLLELVCFVYRCIVTHQQHTLSREFIRSRPRSASTSSTFVACPVTVTSAAGDARGRLPSSPPRIWALANTGATGCGVVSDRLKYWAIFPVCFRSCLAPRTSGPRRAFGVRHRCACSSLVCWLSSGQTQSAPRPGRCSQCSRPGRREACSIMSKSSRCFPNKSFYRVLTAWPVFDPLAPISIVRSRASSSSLIFFFS
jgi:hypothetical protein